MPTINFSLSDLNNLIGKEIKPDELRDLMFYCKGELSSYDKETDEVSVSLDDTNLPYLWSVEGIARLLKGVLEIEKGIPKLQVNKSDYRIIVDPSVKDIRPNIVGFVAKGKKINEYLLKQIIQLQEKLCESYGRKRLKIAVGIYRFPKLNFPLKYKAVDPSSIRFTPLEFHKDLNLSEILVQHPKGTQYSWILEGKSKYPIFLDNKDNVLSFPPIINSEETGKIEPGDEELLFEATGLEEEPLNLAATIFAQALADRGFEIYGMTIQYPDRSIQTPIIECSSIKVSDELIKSITGMDFSKTKKTQLLRKARFEFDDKSEKVFIPCWRGDIMHPVDIIEDLLIVYGFNNIKGCPLTSYSVGDYPEIYRFCNNLREICVGLSMQETFSQMLTCKELLYDKTCTKDFGTIEIKEYMSEMHSVVRSWLIPGLLDILSKNKHRSYPQRIFEQGLVARLVSGKAVESEMISFVLCDPDADFTMAKQHTEAILSKIGLSPKFKSKDFDVLLSGRSAEIIIDNAVVGFIGEVNPEVLISFNLEMPACCMELDIDKLRKSMP